MHETCRTADLTWEHDADGYVEGRSSVGVGEASP